MKELLTSNKKILLMLAAGVMAIVVLFLLVFFPFRQNGPSTPTPTPLPALEVISVFPSDTSQQYLPITQIEFQLSEQVELKNFQYKVEPEVGTGKRYKGNDKKTIIIFAPNTWKPGYTTVTILPTTTATSGAKLKNPYVYTINTNIPKGL